VDFIETKTKEIQQGNEGQQ